MTYSQGSTNTVAVKIIQGLLNTNGALPALVVDGLFGPLTAAAVSNYQGAASLPKTGSVDTATLAALRTVPTSNYQEYRTTAAATLHIQELLLAKGAPVVLHTAFDSVTVAAVKQFQVSNKLTSTGVVDPATLTALKSPTSVYVPSSGGTTGGGGGSTGVLPVSAIALSAVTYGTFSGSFNWATVRDAAMASCGVSGSDWSSGLDIIEINESSGLVNAVNNYDLNAHGTIQSDGYPQYCSRGLCQVIPPTFAQWHQQGASTDIYEPHTNVAAAINYIIGTYGSIDNVPGVQSVRNGGSYQGY